MRPPPSGGISESADSRASFKLEWSAPTCAVNPPNSARCGDCSTTVSCPNATTPSWSRGPIALWSRPMISFSAASEFCGMDSLRGHDHDRAGTVGKFYGKLRQRENNEQKNHRTQNFQPAIRQRPRKPRRRQWNQQQEPDGLEEGQHLKSSKFQAPSSREIPNTKLQKNCPAPELELGAWCFSGCWSLELGCFISLLSPLPRETNARTAIPAQAARKSKRRRLLPTAARCLRSIGPIGRSRTRTNRTCRRSARSRKIVGQASRLSPYRLCRLSGKMILETGATPVLRSRN